MRPIKSTELKCLWATWRVHTPPPFPPPPHFYPSLIFLLTIISIYPVPSLLLLLLFPISFSTGQSALHLPHMSSLKTSSRPPFSSLWMWWRSEEGGEQRGGGGQGAQWCNLGCAQLHSTTAAGHRQAAPATTAAATRHATPRWCTFARPHLSIICGILPHHVPSPVILLSFAILTLSLPYSLVMLLHMSLIWSVAELTS